MHGQSKNYSPLLELFGLCVAWAKSEAAIFFSFSVDLGSRSFFAAPDATFFGVVMSASIGRDNANGRDHAKLSRFAGDGVSPSDVKDYAFRPANAALRSQSDNAVLSSCASRDGAIGRHL